MKYNRFQKFIASLIIFCLLFSITFRIPFFDFRVSATSNETYNLVSIIVDEDTYKEVGGELRRYGKDISSVLENTRVVILPIPKDISPFQIASMNEALYYDGYKTFQNVDFKSRLIGTVLVGNIQLPQIFQGNDISKSVLPYTDFDDKLYIFNRETSVYEYNSNNTSGVKPEIWHGVISPNTGDENEDIIALKNYFSKNHDFYTGEGFYNILSLSPGLEEKNGKTEAYYEPFVFYFDSFLENSGLNYESYLGYKGYLENKENLVYENYTKDLANKLQNDILGYSNAKMSDLAQNVSLYGSGEILNYFEDSLDDVTDDMAEITINNLVKSFLEVFASKRIGDLRENVHNAGRYNHGENVNINFIPYLITTLDLIGDEIIKEISRSLETEIKNLVVSGVSAPDFFKLNINNTGSLTLDVVAKELDKVLDNKSNEIKKYNKSLDIKSFLKNTEIQDVYIYGEAKVFNYYDILIFALYWNNLDLVSEKYKFVFEKYLSSLNSNDGKYYLPQSQNLYEIAYIIAPGNTQNMYVGLDPESKGENMYFDIIGANQELSAMLFTENIFDVYSESDKCIPPQGVPIWEWMPTITCWLKDNNLPIFVGDKNTLTPSKLSLNLGTNIIQTGNNISTNFITILDEFDNITSGNIYNIQMNIDGDGIVFLDNNKKNLTFSTLEGYKVFRLKSTNKAGENTINISLVDNDGRVQLSTSNKIQVLDSFDLNIIPETDFKVGGGNYALQVELKDKNGNLLNNFNSRVYLSTDSNFLELKESYVELENGVGRIEFTTKKTAIRNLPIELQIEGLGDIVSKNMTILPDVPLRTDLVLSKSKLEADGNEYATLQVELKDRYNNLVFNNSSTKIDLEISPKYSQIINSDFDSQITKEGKASFKIYSTNTPGVGHFKISTNPDLSGNSFVLGSETGSLKIKGVGENVGKVESVYIWNKDKLDSIQYNSLYTTLLGSSYGDIEQKNYLAGELIFAKNSKALVTTSLLNNPYVSNNIFSISAKGGISQLYSAFDLYQDISAKVALDNGKIYLNLFNNALNTYIGKIYYALPKNPKFQVCNGEISSCIGSTTSNVVGKSFSQEFNFYTSGGKLSLVDNFGKTYLEVDKDGKILRKDDVNFELVSNTSSYLGLNLIYENEIVGFLGINLVNAQINISREEMVFNNKINTVSNSILVYLNSPSYGYYTTGKEDNLSVVIYYDDPFASDNSLNTFSKDQPYSYENFREKEGVGWSSGNKTLLSFSAGKSVGESLKDFASFSSINIGDPVISLKKIRQSFSDIETSSEGQNRVGGQALKQFDSTIGKLVNQDTDLFGYKVFDYNNDKLKDILLIKNNGHLQLLENRNTSERFTDLGDLAFVVNIGSLDLVQVGDFTGDSYGDIFFVGNDLKPYLLNNVGKDFSVFPLENMLNLNGNIIRAQIFDMDNDGKEDIITLDSSGELNIFYGGGNASNPSFIKLKISSDYGVVLNLNYARGNGLISFDNLKNTVLNALNLKETDTNYELTDNMLFLHLAYNGKQTDFLKTEYDYTVGLDIEKTIKDRNGGTAEVGDIIDVEITITNSSNVIRRSIVYMEDILDYIILNENSIITETSVQKATGGYDLLFDSFSLTPKSSITIKYSGTLKNIKYLDLQVGTFEADEPGNDLYGDIIVKYGDESNSDSVEIFRSTSSRSYEKGIKTLTSFKNSNDDVIDLDDNGIPDYIEELAGTGSVSKNNGDNFLNWIGNKFGISSTFASTEEINGSTIKIDEYGYKKLVLNGGLGISDKISGIINKSTCGFNTSSCRSGPLNWSPMMSGTDSVDYGYPAGELKGTFSQLKYELAEGEIKQTKEKIERLKDEIKTYIKTLKNAKDFPELENLDVDNSTLEELVGQLQNISVVNNQNLELNIKRFSESLGELQRNLSDIETASNNYIPPEIWNDGMVHGSHSHLFDGPGLSLNEGDGDQEGWYFTYTITWVKQLGLPCRVAEDPTCRGEYAYQYEPFIWTQPNLYNGEALCLGKKDTDGNTPRKGEHPLDVSNGVIEGVIGTEIGQGNCTITRARAPTECSEGGGALITGTTKESRTYKIAIGNNSNGSTSDIITQKGKPIGITYDTATGSFDFSDIVEISQKRVNSFPLFFMPWMTRQIEEIVNKLTDFPTLFLVLPDFSGIYDTDTWSGSTMSYLTWEKNREKWEKEKGDRDETNQSINAKDDAKDEAKVQLVNSNIKDTYEFISTMPLISLRQEPINISIPWISETELEKAILQWEAIKQSRSLKGIDTEELEGNIKKLRGFQEKWSGGGDSTIPEKVYELLNKKEEYLKTTLTNIEGISKIYAEWIKNNGVKYKSWVTAYSTIRGLLKSWQEIIDKFTMYEKACYRCQNGRRDLMTYIWEEVKSVAAIPKLPKTEWPKQPDTILDLHNIRAGIDFALPEIHITPEPILLPELPGLSTGSKVEMSSFELPDFESLEELDKITKALDELEKSFSGKINELINTELPNLPDPPSLPTMSTKLKEMVDTLTIILSAMCKLGLMSTKVPEWRVGDQVAYLTERRGFLPVDYISLSTLEFSSPEVDAVQTTTYINLEMNTGAIIQAAKDIVVPIGKYNSDYTNIFEVESSDVLDPATIYDPITPPEDPIVGILDYSKNLAKILYNTLSFGNKNDSELISVSDFQKEISKSLASKTITSNSDFDELREVWKGINSYTYSKENALVAELEKQNEDKFNLVKDIINTEIVKNNKLKAELQEMFAVSTKKVALVDNSQISIYEGELEKYNEDTLNKLKNILNYDENNFIEGEIKVAGKDLLAQNKYVINNENSQLLAANTVGITDLSNSGELLENASTTITSGSGGFDGIYIIENDKYYLLFDYTQELLGNKELTIFDFDNDGDDDMLYFVNGALYLKENLIEKDDKIYLKENPFVITSANNKFVVNNFIEAPNSFVSYTAMSNMINVSFYSTPDVHNYRLSFYDIIDKSWNEKNYAYVPEFTKEHIVDAVAGNGSLNITQENVLFKEEKDIIYISNVGDLRGIEVTTERLKNIKDDLNAGKVVVIGNGTVIYAGDFDTTLTYVNSNYETDILVIPKHSHIELKSTINIVGIVGDGYIRTGESVVYSGTDIRTIIGKPLLIGTKINYVGDETLVRENTYVDLEYYDNTRLNLDFNYVSSWELYDLGMISQGKYVITLPRENDFYYTKLNSFKNDVISTTTNQVLLAPQN